MSDPQDFYEGMVRTLETEYRSAGGPANASANVADGLFAIADALNRIARALEASGRPRPRMER